MWSADEGRLLADLRVQEGVTKSAAFGPDGQVVAVAASAPGLVWHTSGGPLYPTGLRDSVYKRVGVLRGGWVLLGGYDDQVSFVRWGASEVAGAARLGSLLLDLAVSPDEDWGVALDNQGGVYLIEGDPPSSRPFFTDPLPGAVAVARERLAVASENDARVYGRTGTKIASFEAEGIRDIALSADGRWLAAGHASGRTSIWDVTTGVLRAELHGHGARTQGLAFAPDGTWLATASWDGTVRRWGLDVLDAAPADLQRSLELAWGRTLEDLSVE